MPWYVVIWLTGSVVWFISFVVNIVTLVRSLRRTRENKASLDSLVDRARIIGYIAGYEAGKRAVS